MKKFSQPSKVGKTGELLVFELGLDVTTSILHKLKLRNQKNYNFDKIHENIYIFYRRIRSWVYLSQMILLPRNYQNELLENKIAHDLLREY